MKTRIRLSRGWFGGRNAAAVVGAMKLVGLCAPLLIPTFVVAPNSSGAEVIEAWVRRYNDVVTARSKDLAPSRAIVLDAHNNVIVTGSFWTGTNDDAYTAKYAAVDGAVLWERRYNEPGNSGNLPAAVVLDLQSNVIVTGSSYFPTSGVPRHFIIKYAASDGKLSWQHIGPRGWATSAAVLPGGDVIVAGSVRGGTNSNVGSGDIGTNAWYVARYASLDGTLIWMKSGPGGSAEDVVCDALGNVIATGSALFSTVDFYTLKLRASDGTVLWDKRYIGLTNRSSRATDLAVDPDGNVAVTGSVSNGRDSDFYTAKYRASDGFLLWERGYSGNSDEARALAIDLHGNVIVTGSSWDGGPHSYTAKYAAADGALLWETRRPADLGVAVAIDGADNVIVAGNSFPNRYTDFHTAKYAGTNGVLLWEKNYSGFTVYNNTVFTSRSLAVSANGVIAVTGSSDENLGFTSPYDFATVVYWENLPPVSIERLPSAVRVLLAAVPGRVYEVQRASDVNGPWTTLSTATAPANGAIEYLDTSPLSGSVFYRVRTE